GRDLALLPASEEGDARLLRRLWTAHLHRVHEANRCRDQMPRRRPVAPRRPRRCDETETDPEDPARWGRYSRRGHPDRLDHPGPAVSVADLRRGRVRRGDAYQPGRRPQRGYSGYYRLRRRHGDTVPGVAGAECSLGLLPNVQHPRGGTRCGRRRPGEPSIL
ncbi:MAG: Rhomboid family membrane protein, partial [uncultured Rubrobacteraceae bacterium]